jgi:hypothetical protein
METTCSSTPSYVPNGGKMQMFRVLLVLCSVVLAVHVHAADQLPSTFVERGFAAYEKEGPEAAVKEWIKGSGMEGNVQALTQANSLRQVQDYYGPYKGYEIIEDQTISERVHIIFVVMHFAKGPLFVRFQPYKTDAGQWVGTEFKFNTDATMLFPASLFDESGHNKSLKPTR